MYRQIRIEGSVEVLSKQQSDDYFATRPRASQISAKASPQSKVIDSFHTLRTRVAELEIEFAREDVPRPDNWGGYQLIPDCIEFWQGRQECACMSVYVIVFRLISGFQKDLGHSN